MVARPTVPGPRCRAATTGLTVPQFGGRTCEPASLHLGVFSACAGEREAALTAAAHRDVRRPLPVFECDSRLLADRRPVSGDDHDCTALVRESRDGVRDIDSCIGGKCFRISCP